MPEIFPLLSRSVMVVEAREPFIEWVFNIRRAHYGETQVSLDNIKKRFAGRKNAYLVPPGRLCRPGDFVRENYAAIFENELRDWCLRTGLWPEDRSRDVFNRWLACEFYPLLYDAAPGSALGYEGTT